MFSINSTPLFAQTESGQSKVQKDAIKEQIKSSGKSESEIKEQLKQSGMSDAEIQRQIENLQKSDQLPVDPNLGRSQQQSGLLPESTADIADESQ